MLLLQTTGISITTVILNLNTLRTVISSGKREQVILIGEQKDDFQGESPNHSYMPLNKCEVSIGEIYIGRVLFLYVHGPNSRRGTN